MCVVVGVYCYNYHQGKTHKAKVVVCILYICCAGSSSASVVNYYNYNVCLQVYELTFYFFFFVKNQVFVFFFLGLILENFYSSRSKNANNM